MKDESPVAITEQPKSSSSVGYIRWIICATFASWHHQELCMDRQVLGVLKTTLQHDLEVERNPDYKAIWCSPFRRHMRSA